MNWSIRFGRILGIDIKMHITFLLILAWGAFAYGGNAGPLYGLIVTLGLFTLVVLHELGHSIAAMGFGIPVRDITLLPIGGVARLERMPERPLQELVVALAGPAVNVILVLILLPAIVALSVIQGAQLSFGLLLQPGLLGFLTFLLSANISLAIFNMIPAFPLDGGRVFRAILGFFTDYQSATRTASTVGRFLAIGLGLLAIFTGQFWLAIIAFFIFVVGGQEAKAVATRGVLRRAQAGQALAGNTVALSPEATIGQVASLSMGIGRPDFAVLDPITGQLVGIATGHNIRRAVMQGKWYHRVADIMQHARGVPIVAFNAPLDEVQEKLIQTSSRVAAVYDGMHFRGLITIDDIYRAFQFLSRKGIVSPGMGWRTAA
jgi:Zn-dependent protease/predicted transcriptional regulator